MTGGRGPMLRGVNLYPWLYEPGTDAEFTHEVLARLVRTGFGGVRLLVDPTHALGGGAEAAAALGRRTVQAATLCLAAGLSKVVLCLAPREDSAGWSANAIGASEGKVRSYAAVAKAIVHENAAASMPPGVIVELMNEPQLWDRPAAWGPLQSTIYAACRAANPTRTLVLSGPCSSWVTGLAAFDPTAYVADPNVRFSVHWYGLNDDVTFSHQGAAWDPAMAGLKGIHWPKQTAAVTRELGRASAWADQHGLARDRLWLTEFGCLRSADGSMGAPTIADAARFLSDARTAAESLGMGWFVFNYAPTDFKASKGAFSLCLADGSGGWQPELVRDALGLVI